LSVGRPVLLAALWMKITASSRNKQLNYRQQSMYYTCVELLKDEFPRVMFKSKIDDHFEKHMKHKKIFSLKKMQGLRMVN
jgi:hypothetical protein